jgi:hypothetical protein
MSIIYCLLTWILTISCCWAMYQNFRMGLIHLQRLHQIPCSRCKYFVDSRYLKCTINPHLAGSEDAIDCRDHQPQ